MAEQKLFVVKHVSCIVCGKKTFLRYPNPKLYMVFERDSDQRIVSYRWRVKRYEKVQPHYYAAFQCPRCMFATLAKNVETPENTFKEEYLVKAFRAVPDNDKRSLFILNKLVPRGDLDHTGAMALHLAAVYIARLPEKERIDHKNLSRLALRLAWLYRERREREGGGAEEAEKKDTLEQLTVSVGQLQRRIKSMADDLSKAKQAVEARAAELELPAEKEKNPYDAVTAHLSNKLDEMQKLVTKLDSIVLRDAKRELGALDGSGEDAQPSGIEKAFLLLGKLWPELPRDEQQAMRLAVDAFEYSYGNESSKWSIEQNMSTLSLIIDLLVRLGEHERAVGIASELFKTGMVFQKELKSQLQKEKRSGELTAQGEKKINRTLGIVKKSITDAGERRRELLGILKK